MNRGLKRHHRDRHIRRIGRNAVFACAENRVNAMKAIDGRTTGTGLALVARVCSVAKVVTTGSLQQIAAGCSHVPKLRRGTRKQSLGKNGVVLLDCRIMGEIAIADHGADLQPTFGRRLDLV